MGFLFPAFTEHVHLCVHTVLYVCVRPWQIVPHVCNAYISSRHPESSLLGGDRGADVLRTRATLPEQSAANAAAAGGRGSAGTSDTSADRRRNHGLRESGGVNGGSAGGDATDSDSSVMEPLLSILGGVGCGVFLVTSAVFVALKLKYIRRAKCV